MHKTKIRQQIADILRYLPKEDRPKREVIFNFLCRENTDFNPMNIASILREYSQYSPEELYIEGDGYKGYDGFTENKIVVSTKEKVSDEKYLEQVTDYLLTYQQRKEWIDYKNYWKMKTKFEGEN